MKRIGRFLSSKLITSERGQSLVEIAVFLPIFILLISAIAEFGWYLNRYLNLLDSTREATRLAADRDPVGTGTLSGNPAYNPVYNANSPFYNPGIPVDCSTTTETYSALACYTEQTLLGTGITISPTNGFDDIVISAFTIKGGQVYNNYRWPDYMEGTADLGWSLTGNQTSLFPVSRINNIVDNNSPDQGMIIIEVFYLHRQVLGLPFFTIFVPRNLGIHVYTIMPNPTAGTVE
jgi:Flp pilus assembly protein TadG